MIARTSKRIAAVVALALTTTFVGCGGGEEEAPVADIQPIDVSPEPVAKKKSSSSKKRTAKSAMDRIDAALDRDNFMAAVDIAVKSGKSPAERMDNMRYVMEELGDPMARGNQKATQAYQKLNAVWLMMNQAPR